MIGREPTAYRPATALNAHGAATVGACVNVNLIGLQPERATIERVEPNRLTVRLDNPPPAGKRWNMRGIPHGTPVIVGGLRYVKVGGATRTLRLRPVNNETAGRGLHERPSHDMGVEAEAPDGT